MTRLSATATIAALLLLAIAQGFGATTSKSTTKSSPKVASKSTAKPYHITAQNQFHVKSMPKNAAKAQGLARELAREQEHKQQLLQERAKGLARNALANIGANAARRTPAPRSASKPRKQQSNPPPSGTLGFVSATQIPDGGENFGVVQLGAMGSSAAFITIVWNGSAYVYSEVVASGTGTFSIPTPTGTDVSTPTVCGCSDPFFVVGDVNGDGNSDIIEYDGGLTLNVLLSNGDGTFTAAAAGVGPASPFTLTLPAGATSLTGGTGVLNATSGFIDLVVVDNNEPSNLITYAGNGDGTFGTGTAAITAATTTPLVPLSPLDGEGYNVIIQDFDGDGIVDVAENDDSTGQLSVYLSTLTYTASAATTPTAPDGIYEACSSTSGSLTGSSGLPAIIIVPCDYNEITVYNNAAGVFSEGVTYPAALATASYADTFPVAATIADVNGDGNGDVIVVNGDDSDVTILLGNGSGGLATTTVGYAFGGEFICCPLQGPAIVMDLNGDTLPDILIADGNQSLVWMAGFGDGTFQASRDYFGNIPNNNYGAAISIASGDFNGDGNTDVVVSNCCNSTLGITAFLSNPDGSLQPGVNYGSGGTLEYVTVADFNGDGNLDIAASDGEGSVLIFFGTGSGTFVQGPTYAIGGAFQSGITSGAFNIATGVAGFNDLAVVNYDADNVIVLVNDGTGGFVAGAPISLAGNGYEIATAQLGNTVMLGTPAAATPVADLAVADYSTGVVDVLLGKGDGTFTVGTPVTVGGFPYGIALADVNGDGNLDLVATSDPNVVVALGNGDGTFATPLPPMVSSIIVNGTAGSFYDPFPAEIQISDVNGDGVPDLVYVNYNYSTVGVMFGTGTGSSVAPLAPYFYDPVEFPTGQNAYGITIGNIDGDGTSSAVVAPNDFVGASTLVNANGTAAAPNFSLSVSGQSSPAFLNVADGGTATAMITLTPINFYSGTVTFSCGGLPLDVTCAFAPATLTPLGNAPLTTTVTVTTAAPHGALRMPAGANPNQGRTSLLACLTGMGLFGLLLSGDWKNKRNRRVGILLGILVLGMMFSLVGCSSSSTPGTPIGAQTIQVTGTGSDGTTNAVSLTINVF